MADEVNITEEPITEPTADPTPEPTADPGIEDALIALLEGLGSYPVFRQGSLTEEQPYPETFFTFWNSSSADHSHYDDDNYGVVWYFDVNVYSIDAALTYSLLADARTALKSAGWVVPGKGYDLPTDEPTHTGRGISASYLEIEEVT